MSRSIILCSIFVINFYLCFTHVLHEQCIKALIDTNMVLILILNDIKMVESRRLLIDILKAIIIRLYFLKFVFATLKLVSPNSKTER